MARIEGVDLPRNKRIDIALGYLYGVGRVNAKEILEKAQVEASVRTQDLSESDVARIRDVIQRVKADVVLDATAATSAGSTRRG